MLKDHRMPKMPAKDELKARLQEERLRLASAQLAIKDAKLPVMVIFEGWGSSGKGSAIRRVIHDLDPRFYRVSVFDGDPSEDDLAHPFLRRYLVEIPAQGQFKFFDTCWMGEVTRARLRKEISKSEYARRIESIRIAERQLVDDGYLVMKFFFHISAKTQRTRHEELRADKDTRWRVTKADLWQSEHYDACLDLFDSYLRETESERAPWHIVDAEDRSWAALQVLEALNSAIEAAVARGRADAPVQDGGFPLVPMPKLAEVDLGPAIDDADYKRELRELQGRLSELQYRAFRKGIPTVICYEGWDAAGKGGNIKRLSADLDPRSCVVHPIAAPDAHEKARHYLWRFWTRLPKAGHMAIFDRTWYGRVMVERIEGFCSENDWQRAYREINEFEREIADAGAVVLKFWIHIDSATQLARFEERARTPEKQWKITDEDWRNREKWGQYEEAVDDMIAKTSTEFAPWHIIESNDKRYARIKTLRIAVEALERACR